MKFFYLRHKVSGDIIVADFDSNEEGSWVNLSFGGEGEQPYFGSVEELHKILAGHMHDSWSYDIPTSMKKAIDNLQIEMKEVEL